MQPIKIQNQYGFTLMELIMVIVILGVLGVAGADFISSVFLGFSQTNSRLELYEEGKSALIRMERELHGMLPNAICVTNNQGVSCETDGTPGNEIRFGMIGESYMRLNGMVGKYSENSSGLSLVPTVITDLNPLATPAAGAVISIYNTSWHDCVGGGRTFDVSSVNNSEMTLAESIVTPSPHQRYYVLDRGISYRWDSGSAILARKVVAANGSGLGNFSSSTGYPMAMEVTDLKFYYAAPSLARNGIVSILITLSKNGEEVNLHKEIHVKNVP